MNHQRRVAIVGGGLSGLSLAFRLRQIRPDLGVTLLESNSRVGGNIATEDHQGFRVETGPNGFLDTKPHTVNLCRDLGLAPRLIPASEGARKNRYLFWNNELKPLPNSLGSFLRTDLLSWRGKLALITERFRRNPALLPKDESVADFARRRAGKEVATVFADALVTGIHAGDPELLSAVAAFPRLAAFVEEHGSVTRGMRRARKQRRRDALARGLKPTPQQMWSFREGLGVLVEALREQCSAEVLRDVQVRTLQRHTPRWEVLAEGGGSWSCDAVVLTCPAIAQAAIVESIDSLLAEEMAAIPYARVVVVALGFRTEDVAMRNLDGFGYIAPQSQKRDLLGVQWCSSIFPDRAPPGMVLWRALCGGWNRPEMISWSDEKLIHAVRDELRLAMKVEAEPKFTRVIRWPRAIPQYIIGHRERVARIEEHVRNLPGLFIGGNSYYGVAMNDCTEQAVVLASRISGYLF